VVPRCETPGTPSTCGLLRANEVESPVYGAQRLPEQFEGTRPLFRDRRVAEVPQKPVENAGTFDNRVRENLVHSDTTRGEDAGYVLGVGSDERLSQIFRFVLQ
jgi:hypothetical protein